MIVNTYHAWVMLVYHPTAPDEKWKEVIVNEIIQVRDNNIEVEGFEYEELTEILEHICVSWHLVAWLLLFSLSVVFPGKLLFHQKHEYSNELNPVML